MLPILYSFRRCPYAIRARMALFYAGIEVELREVLLRDKPMDMLRVSQKGTVPVLILPDGNVLDESYVIMHWALDQSDPDRWYFSAKSAELDEIIQKNDGLFKESLDRYKYSDRYPEHTMEYYRAQAEIFLTSLEQKLTATQYLLGAKISLADIGIFPFVRQFSLVDKAWFDASPYPKLRRWLTYFLSAEFFLAVMEKHPVWPHKK
ncbi:MAG: glutathione S-transferase [Porticoccus sp.]|jgi:glutathione S-transferase